MYLIALKSWYMMKTLWMSLRMLPRLMTLWRSVSGETGRNVFQAEKCEDQAHVRQREPSRAYIAYPRTRDVLTHVLENEINVPVVVRLVQPDQLDDVLVIGERQQEHYLAERALRVRLIPEGVEDLLHRDGVLPLPVYGLPHDAVSLKLEIRNSSYLSICHGEFIRETKREKERGPYKV